MEVGQGVRIMNLFACSNFIKGYSLAFIVYARILIKRLKNSIWLNQCNLILFQPRFNAHAYISWLWALYNSSKLAMQLQTAANLTSCAYINREFVDRSLNCNVHHVVIRSIDPVLLCRAVYRVVLERQRLATNGELNELTWYRRISTDRSATPTRCIHSSI